MLFRFALSLFLCVASSVGNAKRWSRTATGFAMGGRTYTLGFDDYCCGKASCAMQRELWAAKQANPVATTIPIATMQKLVPTPQEYVSTMLDLVNVGPGDLVYDPGCGDGRILLEAHKRGAQSVGMEINRETADLAYSKVKHIKQVSVYFGDSTKHSLPEATVVALYLYPEVIQKLIPKFLKMKPGTRIVSYSQDLKGLPTVEHVVNGHSFYTFTVGETWKSYAIRK